MLSLKDGSLARSFTPRFCGKGAHWKKGDVIYSLAFLSPFVEDRHRQLHAASAKDGRRLWDAWTVLPAGHREDCVINDPPEKLIHERVPMFDGALAAFSERKERIYVTTKFRYTIYAYNLNGQETTRIGPGTEWDVPAVLQTAQGGVTLSRDEIPTMLMGMWALGDVLAVHRISEEKKMVLDLWRHDGTPLVKNAAPPRGGKILFAWKDGLYVLEADGEYYKDFKIREYRLKRKRRS